MHNMNTVISPGDRANDRSGTGEEKVVFVEMEG